MRDIVLEENSFTQEDTRPSFTQIHRGIRRINDPRKRCVLMTGNGFTVGLLKDLKLFERFPCTDLFSQNQNVEYIPFSQQDKFKKTILLSEDIWPRTYSHIQEHLNISNIWESFNNLQNLNPTQNQGSWTIHNNNLMFELRWYLWFYFRNGIKLYKDILYNLKDWQWTLQLIYLLDKFKFTHITFNYDLFFDLIVKAGLRHNLWSVLNREKEDLELLSASYALNIKIHGSIDKIIPHQRFIGMPNINTWHIDPIELNKNYFKNHPLETVPNYADYNWEKWFWLPEIVPPGRPGNDLTHPDNYANQYAKKEINLCDIIIVCGLSGREPDSDEIKDLIFKLKPSAKIIHVDIAHDNIPITQILENSGCEYIPIKSHEINKIRNHI